MSSQTDNATNPIVERDFVPSYHFKVTFIDKKLNVSPGPKVDKNKQDVDNESLTAIDVCFRDVSGLNIELQTEEIRSGGEHMMVYRLPKPCKYGTLKMSRALPGQKDTGDLAKWAEDAIYKLEIKLKTVQVSLLNNERKPIRTWSFVDAYPVKLSVSEMNATKNELAIESLELVYKYSKKVL